MIPESTKVILIQKLKFICCEKVSKVIRSEFSLLSFLPHGYADDYQESGISTWRGAWCHFGATLVPLWCHFGARHFAAVVGGRPGAVPTGAGGGVIAIA